MNAFLFFACIAATAATLPYGTPFEDADWTSSGICLAAAVLFWCLWVWGGKK